MLDIDTMNRYNRVYASKCFEYLKKQEESMIDVQEMEKGSARYLKLKDAAELLGVKYFTLRAYAKRHGLSIERFPMDANIYLRVEDIEWLREARAKLRGV